MSEHELVEGLIRHDRNAIHQLVRDYQAKIIKTAFYFLQNMEDAEELSQDIIIDVIDSSGRFREASSLSTWIYRITVNRSLNLVKKNKRKMIFRRLEDFLHIRNTDAGQQETQPAGGISSIEETETRMILDKAVRSLSENQRIAFILNKYDDLSYKEIAVIMNLSHSSIESLIHRAKLNLQERLCSHFSEYQRK